MSTAGEKGLLDAARAGDESALEALLAAYQETIYRFGLRMCRDEEDAAEVLQETMLSLVRDLESFRGEASLSTWLYAIARSHCGRKRRRAVPSQASLDEARHLPDPTPLPDEALERRRRQAALADAIESLDPKYREILILRDVEGLRASEVAKITGLGVAAVKSRLHRARRALREKLVPATGAEMSAGDASCPDVLSLYSKHLEGDLDPGICRQMEKHLEGCPRCESACASLRQALALCREFGPAVRVPASVAASVREALRELLAERA